MATGAVEDVVAQDPAHGGDRPAPEAVVAPVAVLERGVRRDDDLHHEEVDSGEWNGTLANEVRIVGTHTGTLKTEAWEIPATRKTITWESVEWIKVRDGKIAWWKEYNDQVPFLVATGLIPDPANS